MGTQSVIEIRVFGLPASQGSFRCMKVGNGHCQLVKGGSDKQKLELEAWRNDVVAACMVWRSENRPFEPLDEPVEVEFKFFMPPVKSDPFRVRFATPSDWDKLSRATCDALVDGRLIKDDGRIFRAIVECWYAPPQGRTGAIVRLWGRGDDEAADQAELKQEHAGHADHA
jgi:Holliday junction resolvase RusA-like endonuclease